MYLDYISATQAYVLNVPREEQAMLPTLMNEHGLDFSTSDSTADNAVLFTKEPYAAASFYKDATPDALIQLGGIVHKIEQSRVITGGGHIDCPPDKEPWPFQIPGVEYVLNNGNSLIGDQCGLGKTAQAIMVANEMRARRVLIICPANIRLQWAKNIREWSTMEGRYNIYPILKSSDGVHPKAEWTIISYDLARNPHIHAALFDGKYDLLVVDEAHYLKTMGTKRTQSVYGGGAYQGLMDKAEITVGLTGTPLPNRPRECYTAARGLCWEAIDFLSEDAFRYRFNPSATIERYDQLTQKTTKYTREQSGRLPELGNRLRANFMIRRLKRDVMTQLPPVTHNIHYVEENGAVRKALTAEKMLDIDPTDLSGITSDDIGHISVIRRMMGVAVAPGVCDYVEMLLDGGVDKILLLAWHHDVLDIFNSRLAKYGISRIDGKTSARNKQIFVDNFANDPDNRICSGNIQSIGTGTDGLQKSCSYVVFGESDWVPGNNFDQGVGRLDRGGQLFPVTADFLVAPDSFLEKILRNAIGKLHDINLTLDQEH